jgi:ferredoxin
MAVSLTIVSDPRRARARRELSIASGTTILRAAHDAGLDVTATCGGRGRCTSCRVKFVAGSVPPPTIGDEVQLGDQQVREGYRLACQCAPTEAVTVELAPPLEETSFQILGADGGVAGRVAIAAGVDQ